MLYKLLVSTTFQKKFNQLEENIQNSIRKTLKELEKDPFLSRPKCDIKLLKDTQPKKYRLRIGEYRIIYVIESEKVKIIDLLKREIGYSRLE
jgi:mRNA-degrading endonuclease RelE of RelBE toxin-antitoxin system